MKTKTPKLLSFDDFTNMGSSYELGRMMGVKINSWDDVFGDLAATNWTDFSTEKQYELYVNWHNTRFTKLGKVLE